MMELINDYECKLVGEMGVGRSDFMEMTIDEAQMLITAKAESVKQQAEMMKCIILNSLANFHRKKGSKDIPLFGKPKKFKSKEAMIKEEEEFWKVVQELSKGTFIEDKD